MVFKNKLLGAITFEPDQKKVMEEYFEGNGRVVVSAGAGTGKTTLLVEIISEAVIRHLETENTNPFEKILAVTFTIEAARQMKNKIRERLKEHFYKIDKPERIKDITRWIESESWIQTLDSLTRKLVSEVAIDTGISSIIDVPDEYKLGQIKQDIRNKLISNLAFVNEIQILERVFPNEEWRGDLGWILLLENTFQKARMYCLSADRFKENSMETFKNYLYLNYKTPFDKNKIDKILKKIQGTTLEREIDPDRVKKSYEYNLEILTAFTTFLKEYERLYDEKTKKNGLLGHDDARHWIVNYAEGKISQSKNNDKWKNTQKKRFKHILVDEFQDTSYAQCALLRNFICETTNVFIIGDPKQAIYEWRSADPEIFTDILNSIPENTISENIPFLYASGFLKFELKSNFRSHPCLIDMYNNIFGENENSIFNDRFYIWDKVLPHGNLEKKTVLPQQKKNEAHIHIYDIKCWNFIPQILNCINTGEYPIHVRNIEEKCWEKATLGDCCILMQSRGRWSELREQLITHGIKYVMLAEKGLFQRPEISLVIDVLD